MKRTTHWLILAALISASLAPAAPASTAPLTPAEHTDIKMKERHDTRDVQTGDYRPHGTLSPEQRDSFAKGTRGTFSPQAPADPYAMLDKHRPY